MLETISEGFKSATERLRGVRELSDENIADSLADVRRSLLEADVDFKIVKQFLETVSARALGEKVKTRARERGGRKVTGGFGSRPRVWEQPLRCNLSACANKCQASGYPPC